MIAPAIFYNELVKHGTDFFAGVPDSLLKDFCAYLTDTAPKNNHIIAANEGAATALAAGYHLATGKTPLVYMQNSGIGNAVNPLLSLIDAEVYAIPLVLVIGWRGEPGEKDEPQHIKQGKVTCSLLETMGIPYAILTDEESQLEAQIKSCYDSIKKTHSPFAFVVKKGIFESYSLQKKQSVPYEMSREGAIQQVIENAPPDALFVSTTGMASRELYELREKNNSPHGSDFLTVGSMGHASQIALSIALQKPERTVYCLDGDGAAIMQMGGLATIGTRKPKNFRHIVLNNGAHDSVGGQPTVGFDISFTDIARAVGYTSVQAVETAKELSSALVALSTQKSDAQDGAVFLEIKVKKGSRADLGRPTATPGENKTAFMNFLTHERTMQEGNNR